MKNLLSLTLTILLQVMVTKAQVNVPGTPANFGSDADTRANFFNKSITPDTDDWFKNLTGMGQQVIDTNGAADIIRQYLSDPGKREQAITRRMQQPSFTNLSGNLLLDAVFHRDHHGSDSTAFGGGADKNGDDPNSWVGKTDFNTNILGKSDILDAFAHLRRDVKDSLWLIGGISIDEQKGESHFDFELFQKEISYNPLTGKFNSAGPDRGHTAWLFDSAGNVTRVGDVIFSVDLNNQGIEEIHTRIWVPFSTLGIKPLNFQWTTPTTFSGKPDGGYAEITPKKTTNAYSAIGNAQDSWAGPFKLVRANENLQDYFTPNQFMEIAVNLTAFGIDPKLFGIKDCSMPFKNLIAKTRSSAQFTAELKDFIGPISMMDFKPVNGYTDLGYYCDSMPEITLQVKDPNPNFIYEWQTSNGNIISQTNGSNVLINKPGLYYVSESRTADCPNTSLDSILIIFDSTCRILDVDIIGFTAAKNRNQAELQWAINNNEDVFSFTLEYSKDGKNFQAFREMLPDNVNGEAVYYSQHTWTTLPGKVYYRIRVTGSKGGLKYSKIAPVVFGDQLTNINIFPNPSRGKTNIEFTTEQPGIIQYAIYDLQGKKIADKKYQASKGGNRIEVTELMNKQKGIYLIKVLAAEKEYNQKLILE